MPNLITRIPPRSVVCVYNCIGSRQAKQAIRGTNHGNERWGSVVILAQERAYPLRVSIRHPYFANTPRYKDGTANTGSQRRAAYQGNFDGGQVTRQAPMKGTLERRSVQGECSMTINSPDDLPAPAGPRVLPDKYPGGVSLVLHEVNDAPNQVNDARELHLCMGGCGAAATASGDFCAEHDPAAEVNALCTHVTLGDSRPIACALQKAPGSEVCVEHGRKARSGATRPKSRKKKPAAKVKAKVKAAPRKRAPRRARQEAVMTLPDLGQASG